MSRASTTESTPTRLTLAWGVHLFTASGAVFGVMALLSVAAGELGRAGLLMLLTLAIDAVDGTLARRVGVSRLLPGVDGRRLDDIVDYLNFAIVPVFFMVWAGNLPGWLWAAPPILASAYGFAQQDAKTEDDFFLGWPSYWNVVALYLWLLDLSPGVGAAWVALFSVAVFVPLKYIYPSRLRVLKRTTAVLGLVWGALIVAAIVFPDTASALRLVELSLAYIVYYLGLSFWLGGMHRGG